MKLHEGKNHIIWRTMLELYITINKTTITTTHPLLGDYDKNV